MSEPTVIEHDPETGCDLCPFIDLGMCEALYDWSTDTAFIVGTGSDERAPDDCPLRSSAVLVRAPQGES
jgi:hypothetical protein